VRAGSQHHHQRIADDAETAEDATEDRELDEGVGAFPPGERAGFVVLPEVQRG
jgi:hypothetical protein